jgi:exonuclease VII small subunit
MDQLAALWRSELAALRSEEAARGQAAVERLGEWQAGLSGQLQALRSEEDQRGQAAVDRLGELQAAMASHLATLGTALEAPMTRLLATASEAPKAAAEVIAQLRQEMSQLTERDNVALQERTALVENIGALLQSVQQTTGEQRAAIETLVTSASGVLNQVSEQFAQTLGAQASRTDEAAAQVAGSAAELASLGEAFQHGVQLFSASQEKLVDNLQRIEGAIQQSMARSDEQLAYYVAQAREVVDLSISAQQGIVEDLRRLRGQPPTAKAAPATQGAA